MPTPPRRVQHPPFITVCPINTREGLDAAMATPEKTAALLNAIVRALGVGRVCTHADGDAMAGLLLGEPLLNWEHLYLLTATLVHRGDNGLEPARVAICSHPDTDADTLVYALWQAPTATLAAVSRATSRLIPNAIDWERRRYGTYRRPPLPAADQRKPESGHRDRIPVGEAHRQGPRAALVHHRWLIPVHRPADHVRRSPRRHRHPRPQLVNRPARTPTKPPPAPAGGGLVVGHFARCVARRRRRRAARPGRGSPPD